MAQFFNQRFCLLQVVGVEPFGEPSIDFRQRCACGVVLALTLPQPNETDSSTEFQRLRPLVACHFNRPPKTRFGFILASTEFILSGVEGLRTGYASAESRGGVSVHSNNVDTVLLLYAEHNGKRFGNPLHR